MKSLVPYTTSIGFCLFVLSMGLKIVGGEFSGPNFSETHQVMLLAQMNTEQLRSAIFLIFGSVIQWSAFAIMVGGLIGGFWKQSP